MHRLQRGYFEYCSINVRRRWLDRFPAIAGGRGAVSFVGRFPAAVASLIAVAKTRYSFVMCSLLTAPCVIGCLSLRLKQTSNNDVLFFLLSRNDLYFQPHTPHPKRPLLCGNDPPLCVFTLWPLYDFLLWEQYLRTTSLLISISLSSKPHFSVSRNDISVGRCVSRNGFSLEMLGPLILLFGSTAIS